MARLLAGKGLLIGWDAADWKVATPLMDQGLMPTLNDLVNTASWAIWLRYGRYFRRCCGTPLQRADKHGNLGFTELNPQSGGVRPVSSTSRKAKAIWNILSQRGFKTHVLGWFAGHPAEPINGISVSDLYPYPPPRSTNSGRCRPAQSIPRACVTRRRWSER